MECRARMNLLRRLRGLKKYSYNGVFGEGLWFRVWGLGFRV